jgi:protein-S-isoprenylcysteine O-methyltransferase Ste14
LTSPPSTVTSTSTRISTLTQTSSSIPEWAYGVMAVLLIVGLAIGYVVKRPSAKQG